MTTIAPRTPRPLAELDPDLDAIGGTVSVWCGRPGGPPAYQRLAHRAHYAASTMKVAVMAAAYRRAVRGELDLEEEIVVHDDFASAQDGAGRFRNRPDYDNDPLVWQRLGGTAPLRWLIRRMIVKSSNLATNLVLERTGLLEVGRVWEEAGAEHAVVRRGIEDYAAEEAGKSNIVTAADLAGLLSALRRGRLADPDATREMLDVLLAQEVTEDVVRGLPAGTRVAHKNGWVEGVRHSAALVMPDDAPEFVLVTCVTASLDAQAGCEVVARVARAAWSARHDL